MKCTIPEISWHNKDPVLTVDVQPCKEDAFYRVATGGADCHIVIWLVKVTDRGYAELECMADLTRHNRAVNILRFSPSGTVLASADDEAVICLWCEQEGESSAPDIFSDKESESQWKEKWNVWKVLRGHLEDIYDLSWSPDGNFLLSGSIDNSAIIWDVHKGMENQDKEDPGLQRLFHDETLQTFSRRLGFSPDGNLLFVPTGVLEPPSTSDVSNDLPPIYACLVFSRHSLARPVAYLPSGKEKIPLGVRVCPQLFERTREDGPYDLPYNVVVAVITQDSLLIYNTEQETPVALISNIHYTRLTDCAWSVIFLSPKLSADGRLLIVSSTDGYCSVITFSAGELGKPYKEEQKYNAAEEEEEEEEMEEELREDEKKDPPRSAPSSSQGCSDEKHTGPANNGEEAMEALTLKEEKGKRATLITLSSPKSKKTGRRVPLVTLSTSKDKDGTIPDAPKDKDADKDGTSEQMTA
ncbi:unnamed protein product [Darwinula stevensoni]|uniref:CAF1B/HIR1 beta-propeller domain-containing protein n=1 Tax=Darwinula stevensoni TaxID=69355 RepID=A0A7R9A4C7_9CRUS|nr:unnamed protein product [Darwinula stevensoni]CAG0892297.1 unnamed protein product [Darwinula stevensoni]